MSNMNLEDIENSYKEIIDALRYAADLKQVDESYAVQKEILAELSLVALLLENGIEREEELYLEIKQKRNTDKTIFEYELIDEDEKKAVKVNLNSKILDVSGFPFTIKSTDNINSVVVEKLKRKE